MDKIALVTGGAKGIGAEISRKLSADGYIVIINYCHSKEKAETLCREINERGNIAHTYCCSVENEEQVNEMFEEIRKKYGKVNCLVNNAGISYGGYLMTQPAQEIIHTLSVNLTGTLYCCKAVLPHMISMKSGRIVNIASAAGIVGMSGQTVYSASKSAVLGLTRSLASETAKFGIQVNAVSPGYVDTDMLADIPENLKAEYIFRIPMKRFAYTEEIAYAVSWLCSEQCSYMTGQNIVLDGGLSIV